MASINISNPVPTGKLIFPSDLQSEGNARFMQLNIKTLEKFTLAAKVSAEEVGPTIILPMPNGLTDEYSYSYVEDSLGPVAARLRANGTTTLEAATGLAAGVAAAGLTGAAAGYANRIPGGAAALEAVPKYARTLGIQLNPGLANNFGGFGFKVHSFLYILVPRNESDSNMISDIIGVLRYASAPAGMNTELLERPNVFEISFSDPNYLYKPGLCALRNMSVTYNPTKSSYYKNSAPSEVAIAMEFVELTQAFKERQAADYPRYNYQKKSGASGP